jgi:hypothetical protein
MNFKEFVVSYGVLIFIASPFLIFLIYFIITELLDLLLNSGKINKLLMHSDKLNIDHFETQHENCKIIQSNLNFSNLQELERQMNYQRLKEKTLNWRNKNVISKKEEIIIAKELSDIFKIK